MATTVPTGQSQGAKYPVKLWDADGSYIVLLNPENIPERWECGLLPDTEFHEDADLNTGATYGKFVHEFQFTGCKWANDHDTWENFKKALVTWSKANNNPSLSIYNSASAEMAEWPAFSDLTMTQIKVRVTNIAITQKTADLYVFNVSCRRFNTA